MATKFFCDRCGTQVAMQNTLIHFRRYTAEDIARPIQHEALSSGRWEVCLNCDREILAFIKHTPAREAKP